LLLTCLVWDKKTTNFLITFLTSQDFLLCSQEPEAHPIICEEMSCITSIRHPRSKGRLCYNNAVFWCWVLVCRYIMFMFQSSSTAMLNGIEIYIIGISYIPKFMTYFFGFLATYSGDLVRISARESYALAAYL
jgi:hypothetical protein